jgi:ferredoxin hydrogenase small subunit
MSFADFTRRQFLKASCVVAGGMVIGLRTTRLAVAAIKQLKDFMLDRINGVYGADAKFKIRASQDNPQVKALYKNWLEKPMSHKAEQFLHMHFTDRSKNVAALTAAGKYPNPRQAEFDKPYPF